jgi:hypothetical protein
VALTPRDRESIERRIQDVEDELKALSFDAQFVSSHLADKWQKMRAEVADLRTKLAE